jgi:hypothetical protein
VRGRSRCSDHGNIDERTGYSRSMRRLAAATVAGRALVVGWALVALVALVPAPARANGRPPQTNGVHFRPGDPHAVYLATTFGLLVSRDDGCTFHWICEDNIRYGGTFDPKYRIASDGTIFATTYTGLRISRDGGCSFSTATDSAPTGDPGRIAESWIDAIDIGPTGDVWVATSDNGKTNNVYRSTDNGATFAPRGLSSLNWWKSVAVAPSRAQRVYVTGYQVAGTLPDGGSRPPTTHLEISDDTGEHWTESPLTGVQVGAMPLVFALAVDPGNPDRLLLASSLANNSAGDRLYRSTDGGMTFTEVLVTSAPITDLAFERTGTVVVTTFNSASYQSTDRGMSFTAMTGVPQLACVGERGDGEIFGCGTNWEPDFKALARSVDGARWDKAFRFVELAGPLDCPAGTAERDTCAGLWPALQQQFGATGPTCGNPPADDAPNPLPRGGGCCETGRAGDRDALAGGIALAAAVFGAIVLRRRRGRGCCRG